MYMCEMNNFFPEVPIMNDPWSSNYYYLSTCKGVSFFPTSWPTIYMYMYLYFGDSLLQITCCTCTYMYTYTQCRIMCIMYMQLSHGLKHKFQLTSEACILRLFYRCACCGVWSFGGIHVTMILSDLGDSPCGSATKDDKPLCVYCMRQSICVRLACTTTHEGSYGRETL